MQSSGTYRLIWILVCFVLATGLIFPPLMDYDAAEYAGIAMTMYQRNDWLNIINRQYAGGCAVRLLRQAAHAVLVGNGRVQNIWH